MACSRASSADAPRRRSAWAAYRWLQAAALVGAILFCRPAAAVGPGDSSAYKLAPGDRITVTVLGQPDVSGDILIDGAGNIVMPFIGSITVKDLTILECQKLIVDRLADGVFNQPSVSVRISELRPLYVLGDVRTPGAYPFRYGVTVKSAIALAGGFGVAEQSQSVSEFLLADEHVLELAYEKQSLLVRLARVEAQRDGKETFSPPAAPGQIEGDDMADLIAIEQDTLNTQAAMLKAQLELMRSQQPRLQVEINALNAQIATENKELELVREQSEQYGQLMKKGLGQQNTELQLKLEEANHESNVWRLTAEGSRLQRDSTDLTLKIQDAEATYKRQVVAELLEVRRRLNELDITLPIAREVREARLQQAVSLTGIEAARTITVTRSQGSASTVIQVSETMRLEPGDIIEVKKLLPRDPSRVSDSIETSSATPSARR
jgi:polysaccharide export outer membrane protein